MEIRRWLITDLQAVEGLLRELCDAIGMPYHGRADLLQHHFRVFEAMPQIYANFVAVEGQDVVGFASVAFYGSVLHRKGTALINELVVSRDHRGRGVGKALLNHCVTLAERQGYDEVEVGVEPENREAIAFYKRNGVEKECVLLGKEFDED